MTAPRITANNLGQNRALRKHHLAALESQSESEVLNRPPTSYTAIERCALLTIRLVSEILAYARPRSKAPTTPAPAMQRTAIRSIS